MTSDIKGLRTLKDKVLSQWRFRARSIIPEADKIADPILINTLPIFLDQLIDAMENSKPFATVNSTQSFAHGRERALMTDYSCAQVIHEIQLLGKVIRDLVEQEAIILPPEHQKILESSIEVSIREAASSFSEMQSAQAIEFISSFVHDIRNPLHVALGTAQLLALRNLGQRELQSADKIKKNLYEAETLIDSLLDATTSGNSMKLNLNIDTVDMTALAREIALSLELEGQPILVSGEQVSGYWCRTSLKRALQNLVTNAQNYGDRTAPITIDIRTVDSELMASVHNEGLPIPKIDLDKLFSGYRRLQSMPLRGWGLGLPFVHRVAEAHGGSVIVESDSKAGTTFTIVIPLDGREFALEP